MKTLLLLWVLRAVIGELLEIDRTCGDQENCVNREQCPAFQQKHQKYKNHPNKQSSEYESLKEELVSSVCNKKQKGVCCGPCEAGSSCIARTKCQYFDERMDQYKELKARNQREKAQQIIDELRNLVCNKEKRLVCCPTTTTSLDRGPEYLPSLGSCGLPTTPPSNVVGGENTVPGEFPFAALLGYERNRKTGNPVRGGPPIINKEIHWTCGGTLINQWYVLTAAHCQGRNANQKITKLRLGDWSIEGYGGETGNDDLPPEQDFDITEDAFKKHEDYGQVYDGGKKNTVNDIALVKLPRPAILNSGVQLACLPFQEQEIQDYLRIDDLISGLVGRLPTVIGWGKTDADQLRTFDGLGSRILQKLEKIPILSNTQCRAKRINVNLRETQICVGGEQGRDSCRGDSGSGLYIQQSVEEKTTPWYLIGIVSFGSRDCGNGRPGVYTRVSSFIPWIVKNLK